MGLKSLWRYNLSNEKKYLKLLSKVLDEGTFSKDRTGTGTHRVFGSYTEYQIKYKDCFGTRDYYPIILTTKRMSLPTIIHELLWIISGSTNTKYLTDNKVTIWNEWADENGELGPVYGKQWRDWNGLDQIKVMHNQIRNNPDSRRIIVEAWNVGELSEMKLPPCHKMFQVFCNGETMDLLMYQRSADMFLGVPYNLAFYSILLIMLCHVHGYIPGKLIHVTGDTHIYSNHEEQVLEQLSRPIQNKPPTLSFSGVHNNLDDFKFDDFKFGLYIHQPAIKAPVAI